MMKMEFTFEKKYLSQSLKIPEVQALRDFQIVLVFFGRSLFLNGLGFFGP